MMMSRITMKLTMIFLTLAIVSDARSLLGKLHKRKSRNLVVVDRFGGDNPSPKDAWEVNQGLNSTFFQGDIVLTADMLRLLNETSSSRRRRAIKKDPSARWTNGIVPYTIDRRLTHSAKLEIRKAIRHWKKHTCIKFHKKRSGDVDYLRFAAEDGCWSSVGRKGGKQDIGVGKGCEYAGTIIHEIGHALGFWHEQSRSDRDTYVRVVWKNIEKKYHGQFNKMDANVMDSMGYAYDYESVMHYGSKFFTKNGKDTIRIRKPGLGHVRIGQRKRLSDIDLAQIHAMYNCNKIATPNSAKCIRTKTKDGRDYDGKLSYTEKGVTCQAWNSNWPHRNTVYSRNFYTDYTMGLMEPNGRGQYMYHNYCRNPQGKRKRPWCYTTLTRPNWQYCDLKICR